MVVVFQIKNIKELTLWQYNVLFLKQKVCLLAKGTESYIYLFDKYVITLFSETAKQRTSEEILKGNKCSERAKH